MSLTVHLKAGRSFGFAHTVLRHAGVRALILSSHLTQAQAVVTADLESAKHIYRSFYPSTAPFTATHISISCDSAFGWRCAGWGVPLCNDALLFYVACVQSRPDDWLVATAGFALHNVRLWRGTEGISQSVSAVLVVVPAPWQFTLLSAPADSRRWVSVHLAVEVHRVIRQHHLVHRLFGEHWSLW